MARLPIDSGSFFRLFQLRHSSVKLARLPIDSGSFFSKLILKFNLVNLVNLVKDLIRELGKLCNLLLLKSSSIFSKRVSQKGKEFDKSHLSLISQEGNR